MNLAEVNDAIKELQESSLTLSNARNLSALINVRDYLQNVTQSVPDSLERELNDILPQYKEYCAVKRQYQLGRATEDLVIASMRLVCKEVKEFLLILYQNTDTQIERNMLKRMLKETKEALYNVSSFFAKNTCIYYKHVIQCLQIRKIAVSNDRKEHYEKLERVGSRL